MEGHTESARPLPDMLGDVAPEHDLRGRMIVLVIYASGALAWAALVFGMRGVGERLVGLVVGALLFACAAFVARAVERFACWSWFFAVGWLVLILVEVALNFSYQPLSGAEAVSVAAGAMMLLGALHYLWLRRWDFWVDARLERRRRGARVVTPEWRAARLAAMGPSGRARLPAPVAGALWMRRASPARAGGRG